MIFQMLFSFCLLFAVRRVLGPCPLASLSLCLPVSLSRCLSLSLGVPESRCLCASVSLSLCLSLLPAFVGGHHHHHNLRLCLSASLSLCLSACPASLLGPIAAVSLFLCLSVSLSLCLSVSLSLALAGLCRRAPSSPQPSLPKSLALRAAHQLKLEMHPTLALPPPGGH